MNNENGKIHAKDTESGAAIAKFAAIVAVFKFSYFIIGFAVKFILARVASLGFQDAYYWAWENFNLVFTIGEDLLGSSYLPVFVQSKVRDGEDRAWFYSSCVLTVQAIIAIIAAIVIIFFASDWVAKFGGSLVQQDTAKNLLIIFISGLTFLTLASTLTQNLNAYRKFTLAAFSEFANKIMVAVFLVGAIYFAPRFLNLPEDESARAQALASAAAYAAAIGFLVGVIAKFALNLFGLRKQIARNMRPNLRLNTPEMKALGLLVVVLLIGSVGGKVRDLIEIIYKQSISGVISYVSYAKSLKEIAVVIFPFALGVVLFPYLSEAVARDDRKRLTQLTMNSMRILFLIFTPITLAYCFFGTEIVGMLFSSTTLTLADMNNTGNILAIYSVGFIAYCAEIIVLQTFFSYRDVITPTIISLMCAIVHVVFLWAYFDSLSYLAIPLAYLASRFVKAVTLFALLLPRLKGGLDGELKRWMVFGVKILVAAAAGAGACYLVAELLPAIDAKAKGLRMLFAQRTLIGFTASFAAVGITAWIVRLHELNEAVAIFAKGFSKVSRIIKRG